MTITQSILVLRHVYASAVQLCRCCAGAEQSGQRGPILEVLKDERDRTLSSTCCSQGKVQQWCSYLSLLCPIPSIDSYLKAQIAKLKHSGNPRARSIIQQRAIPLPTSWTRHPAEATGTRLGPDGADIRKQRSTLTKLSPCGISAIAYEGVRIGQSSRRLGCGHRVGPEGLTHPQPPTTFLRQARKWRCLSAIPTPTRETVDRKVCPFQVHGHRCPDGRPQDQVLSSLRPSPMALRYTLLFTAEDCFHNNLTLYGVNQVGPPIARKPQQIDNGVQLREVPAGLGLDDENE
ncbi:BZ3500_MvSof-1268-A1-R1_Chr10-2g02874 [Microbotryum saponariae]|uniref:BZ3500_MvSof-1268-A1-R1_Chr10-2g02874 protein n=1 Tax=Microbotryum saponariae TaxID=289078 RepID=A0A2X0K5U9_9BASI|nr:BZ3501_MvSof-1269-A2-R1_Chr10-2g02460 [Microbotryum saponariae]SDA01650.1 BZ3500_MvSof-1268-A1-R1_Chr10-2g02874 [Microbotryum saponariae]